MTSTTNTTTSITKLITSTIASTGGGIRVQLPRGSLRPGMEREVVFSRFPDMGEARTREYLSESERFMEIHRRLQKRGEETWTADKIRELLK